MMGFHSEPSIIASIKQVYIGLCAYGIIEWYLGGLPIRNVHPIPEIPDFLNQDHRAKDDHVHQVLRIQYLQLHFLFIRLKLFSRVYVDLITK